METAPKQVSVEVRDKLEQTITKQAFMMVAISTMNMSEDNFNQEIWNGCYLLMHGLIQDMKEIQAALETQ